ncbi:39S ribosomal protein L16, mitochondrial [Entomophthora muscae]|uniref:39S ribosomal protein L16, mitochondrial n=1 Tax=Entomophthora muscae TaxID=34485 RepID=A0ACC2TWT7_9FUNG|nr:39S ribosomal protein L16, mitochondrial [Entomophthora muscae]
MALFKSLLGQGLKFGAINSIKNVGIANNAFKITPSILQGVVTPSFPLFSLTSSRSASNLAPRKRKHRKAQKGRVPVRTGGSQKGNFVAFGDYGLRVKEGVRLSADVLTACQNVIRRKVKAAKGTKIWMRVFPDIPVSAKGNESRMGKGKGAFEYWACRVPKDKIIFEIGGPTLPIELAKEAFRLAMSCLPVKAQFVDRYNDPHRAAVLKLAEQYPEFPALKVPELPAKANTV